MRRPIQFLSLGRARKYLELGCSFFNTGRKIIGAGIMTNQIGVIGKMFHLPWLAESPPRRRRKEKK